MYIETDITGEEHFVYKRKGQKDPHFIISGACYASLDKRKIREYLNGCDWSDRACPAWFPATMRPDDFMKHTPFMDRLSPKNRRRLKHGMIKLRAKFQQSQNN